MQRLYVLYDGRCGLCRVAHQWLERQETLVELEFLAAGSFEAARLFPTLADNDRPEELIVVSEEGGVYRGGHAWIMCLYALEDYREWAERLSSPALLPLARQGFAMLSKQRGRISRWLGLASEHEIVEALRRVVAPTCEITPTATDREDPSRFQGRVERLALLAKQVHRDVERRVPPAV
jgi:predicted DCC family thiol-disulfide oxidoreductase YuxK